MHLVPLILITGCFAVSKQPSENETVRVTVHTSRGDVRGFHVNNALLKNFYEGEADVFLGVPYAMPPIGEKRFKKPQIIGKYDKTIEANRYGAICPQYEGEFLAEMFQTGMDEDCLTLNIFAPNVTDKKSKYPVLVYIHGGGFKFGGVAEWMYHGIVSNLVRRGIVFVTLNYRVGMLGFFTTFTKQFPPNRGIWDQITALKWIQEEIVNFGGDPEKVTLIGHSAGACSASSLAQSPAVDDSLFRGVILLSCAAEVCFDKIYGNFTQSFDRAKQICSVEVDESGWTKEKITTMEECLSKLNHKEINAHEASTFRWNTVIDGELFPDVPSKMKWKNIPVMMGSTEDEYAFYAEWALLTGKKTIADYTSEFVDESIREWVKLIFGAHRVQTIMQLVYDHYHPPEKSSSNIEQTKYMNRVLSDLIYIRAVGDEAIAHIRQGNKNVWLWQIAFHSDYYSFYSYDDYKPVFHGMELFLLMQPDYAWTENAQPTRWGKAEEMAADKIAEEFIHFVKFGKPSGDWKPLNVEEMNFWKLDGKALANERKETYYSNGYGGEGYAFWRKIADEVANGEFDNIIRKGSHEEL
uniref:Carboxylic ester hydrolase n=1 Tax=Parascaris univalens TaxID=6257 RepID=A0A915CES6_PARUN